MKDESGRFMKPIKGDYLEYISIANFASNKNYPMINWMASDSVVDPSWKTSQFADAQELSFSYAAPENWCDGTP